MPLPPGALVPIAYVGAVAAAAAGVVQWRRARALEDTPTSKIRSAAQGYVEFSGQARALPGDPVVSPLTHRACVWWQYRVEERSNVSRRGWTTVDHGTSDAIFALDDGTGRVIINPDGANVSGVPREVWYGNDPDTPPAVRPPRWMGLLGGRYRYTERLILDGQLLSAVGEFHTQRAADDPVPMDVEMAERLRAWKHDPARMASFDADHDGNISPQEWEQARAAARAEILAEHHEQARQPGLNMLVRPADHRPFLFGEGSVRALSHRYRVCAALLSGAALISLAVGTHWLGR